MIYYELHSDLNVKIFFTNYFARYLYPSLPALASVDVFWSNFKGERTLQKAIHTEKEKRGRESKWRGTLPLN